MASANSPKKCFLFCGDDDFLVDNAARSKFLQLVPPDTDPYSREIIDGDCSKIADLDDAFARFSAAIHTLSLFGGDKKFVWFRNINWLSRSNKLSASEDAKDTAAKLVNEVENLDTNAVTLVISATAPDGVRKDVKALKAAAHITEFPDAADRKKGAPTIAHINTLLDDEAAAQQVKLAKDTRNLLLEKVGKNVRLAVAEIRKLATYLNKPGGSITPALINQLVPVFGENDFFEPVELFYERDLTAALDALHRFFFADPLAGRALHASLLNRNRLLIQIRLLLDNDVYIDRFSMRGDTAKFRDIFGDSTEKSPTNVFSQSPYYVGDKLAPNAEKFPLRKLIDIQLDLTEIFQQLIFRSDASHEQIFNEFFCRHLAAK